MDGPITLVACWELIEPHFGQLDHRFKPWLVCYCFWTKVVMVISSTFVSQLLLIMIVCSWVVWGPFKNLDWICVTSFYHYKSILGGFLNFHGVYFSHYRGSPCKDLVSLSLIITCFTIVWLVIFIVFYWWYSSALNWW